MSSLCANQQLLEEGMALYETNRVKSLLVFQKVSYQALCPVQLGIYHYYLGCLYFSAGPTRHRKFAAIHFRHVMASDFVPPIHKVRAYYYSGIMYAEGVDGVDFCPHIAYQYLIHAIITNTDINLQNDIGRFILYLNNRIFNTPPPTSNDSDVEPLSEQLDKKPRVKRIRKE